MPVSNGNISIFFGINLTYIIFAHTDNLSKTLQNQQELSFDTYQSVFKKLNLHNEKSINYIEEPTLTKKPTRGYFAISP